MGRGRAATEELRKPPPPPEPLARPSSLEVAEELAELRKRIEDLEYTEPKATEKEPVLAGQAAAIPIDVALVTLLTFALPALPAAVVTALVVILVHLGAAVWSRAKVTPNAKL